MPKPTIVFTKDGEEVRVLDEPDTAWDRDVRAFYAAMAAERGQRSMLSERCVDPRTLASMAVTAADVAENARRARAAQTGPKIGRCDVTVRAERGPRDFERCVLLGGHDGPHKFE